MAKNISKAFTLSAGLWRKIATLGVELIKVRTARGIDREGRKFPPYSKRYIDRKALGFVNKSGKRGTTAVKGISLDRFSATPNFRLRGFTMRDLKIRAVSRTSALIGWLQEFATIVSAHEDRGKYKVGGVSDKDFKKIINLVDDEMVKNWNRKTKDQVIHVKM